MAEGVGAEAAAAEAAAGVAGVAALVESTAGEEVVVAEGAVAAVQLVLPSRWTLSQRFGFGLQESPSLHFQELACSRFRIAIG